MVNGRSNRACVGTGTPAARLYATWALDPLDTTRATPHFIRLSDDRSLVSTRRGCETRERVVADVVAELVGPAARRPALR